MALGLLPWVVFSRMGEWNLSASDPEDPKATHTLTARAVVSSERVLFATGGKRADGTRHVPVTPPASGMDVSVVLVLGWEANGRDAVIPAEPIGHLQPARGPPSLATRGQ